MRLSFRSITLAGAALFATVCIARSDDRIQSYSVPKEHPPAAMPPGHPALDAPDIPVNAAPVRWTVPEDWQELAPTAIRIGNFAVPGKNGKKAEVAVTSFPGSVGTELDNVNRWRGEVGLPPVDESALSSQPVTVDSFEGKLFDLTGPSARTVVAMVPRNGSMWFFKLRGDAEVVAAAKPAFSDFLKSVHFSAASEPAPAPAAVAPPSLLSPPAESSSGLPKWQVPAGWTEAEPGPMILKKFSIADAAGAKASVSISSFPGDVGGTFANVNRWRGQMGLSAVTSDQLAGVTVSLDTTAGKATLVDFTGKDAKAGRPARLVGAIVPQGDKTWFYKLLGDAPLVGREKDNFLGFVKGVQYQ